MENIQKNRIIENEDINVFEKIIESITPLLDNCQNNISGDSKKYKLNFKTFVINILFGIIYNLGSVSLLITEIKTSKTAKVLGLVLASSSMYSEAFNRYGSYLLRNILMQMLETIHFLEIPDIKNLGRILLIDGSIFPAIKTMSWACYKEGSNAIKLHVAMSLNMMIPIKFLSAEGNSSERNFLRSIIEKSTTYVCDRGYICFDLFKEIAINAFFVIRVKSNMRYKIITNLTVDIPDKFSNFVDKVTDVEIIFKNDKHKKKKYRLVSFSANCETYMLCTNRFDLSTFEIITLYAYRWQIELLFRFLKRTFNCIHLMSHSENGVELQFYLYTIAHLLLLSFKQECIITNEENKQSSIILNNTGTNEENKQRPIILNNSGNTCNASSADTNNGRRYARGLVSLLGGKLKHFWKLGIHWLATLKNILIDKFSDDIAKTLAA